MLTRRVGAIALASVIALAIVAYGQLAWGGLAYANVALTPRLPWAGPVMLALLGLLYWVLSGRALPNLGGETRRSLLNLNPVPIRTVAWSLAGGACAVVALAGLWIVLSQIMPWAPNLLPSTAGVPRGTLIVLLAVGSLAAPLSEEAAFRGYAQGLIERAFRPWTAVVIVSAMFAAVHLTQGLYPGKLLVYFLAGLTFGATARLSGSIVPSILVHALADITFFTLVWPHDGLRTPVFQGGVDLWFWIHLGQTAVFAPLSVLAFLRLARTARPAGGLRGGAGSHASA